MCILFSLSKYIIIPLLTEWLQGRELVTFDSALTNHEERNTLFAIIECHRKPFQASIFSVFSFNPSSHLMFRYAKARGFDLAEYKLLIYPGTLVSLRAEIGIKDRTLKTKFSYLKDIRSIEVNVNGAKEAHLVSRLLQCFPLLTSLKSNGCNMLQQVSTQCKYLTHLDLGRTTRQVLHLEKVFSHCKSLTHFTWVNDDYLCDRELCAVIVHGRSLQSIVLDVICSYRCKTMFSLHGGNSKLTSLTVDCPDNMALSALLWCRGAALTKFSLTVDWYDVSLASVKDIHTTCPHVTDIALPYVDTDALCTIFKNVKCLKHFATGSLCDKSVAELAKVSTLESLSFHSPWSLSFESLLFRWDNLAVLTTQCGEHTLLLLKHCPNLRELILLPSYEALHGKWLDAIIPELGRIQVLEVLQCYWTIPASTLQSIVDHCLLLTDLYCNSIGALPRRFKIHPNRENQYSY